ncbi:sensor histidine kinase [Geomesophilobacter sediminis]|uniref:histidine kinase n=1 Tax=Geomesophilobacter sediminis TaxID=2798584 RepID=A0A8J7J4K7_9BACT|nr:ATP-binding protein [Geomesophilobacter sediminis]MBJ6723101.1 PAS domain-containing protein [Geomesophilobacter sediminis]
MMQDQSLLSDEIRKGGRALSVEESQRLLHELQVHQIKLEMQNQEIVNARLEVEAALERYADFYDFAPVGFLTLDYDGVIRAANLTAAAMLGTPRSCLIGRHLEMLVTEGRPAVRATVQQVFGASGKSVCDATVLQGEEPLYLRIEATTSRSGNDCRAVLIDLTERRRLETELTQLNEELERRVQARTAEMEAALREQESFSYTVSHDLRSPLRHINGYLSILKEDFGGEVPEEAIRYIDRACEVTSHMGSLIDNLLNLSRIARSEVVRERVYLSEFAEGILTQFQEAEPQRRVECVIQKNIVLQADRMLMWALLRNLLENAWKYTSQRETARIELASREVGGRTVVEVVDNGVGFDMAYGDQLFGVFQRLHGKEFGGLGIGLATVKRIVERHGGEIWAESQVDGGARFSFTVG